MAITQKFEVGISSNFLYSIRTSICIRKCDKNFLHFWSHFLEKTMGYSPCFFFKNWLIFKMLITPEYFFGISPNFLHSIRTSIRTSILIPTDLEYIQCVYNQCNKFLLYSQYILMSDTHLQCSYTELYRKDQNTTSLLSIQILPLTPQICLDTRREPQCTLIHY